MHCKIISIHTTVHWDAFLQIFEFRTLQQTTRVNYHKNTSCKILADSKQLRSSSTCRLICGIWRKSLCVYLVLNWHINRKIAFPSNIVHLQEEVSYSCIIVLFTSKQARCCKSTETYFFCKKKLFFWLFSVKILFLSKWLCFLRFGINLYLVILSW